MFLPVSECLGIKWWSKYRWGNRLWSITVFSIWFPWMQRKIEKTLIWIKLSWGNDYLNLFLYCICFDRMRSSLIDENTRIKLRKPLSNPVQVKYLFKLSKVETKYFGLRIKRKYFRWEQGTVEVRNTIK